MFLMQRKTTWIICWIVCISCVPVLADFPFRNTSLSWAERAEDLVQRLTLEEIQDQLAKGTDGTPPIPRLGIGQYVWWSNCGRGDVRAGNATSYPESIGLAAAFSPDLMFRVARAGAYETRAKNNYYVDQGSFLRHQGLSCFSPNMDLLRDPRWGRNEGTWGEDPYLAGVYAKAFVSGIQGDDPRYLILSASCKHYTASGGPDSYPLNRMSFNAEVSMRDLRTTFLPGFRECVNSGSYSVLCAYNRINGIPACANNFTLRDILRKEWGFNGYVISDVGAMEGMITAHHYYKTFVDVAAGGLSSGCNINAAQFDNRSLNAYYSAVQAIKEGKLSETTFRELTRPLWYTRLRLGEFDPPDMVPYKQLNLSVIQSPEHRALSVEAAMKTFVLLKNLNHALPLQSTKYGTIAIIGPMSNNPDAQTGNYSPTVMLGYTTTPLDGLSPLAVSVRHANGCLGDNNCTQFDPTEVQAAVTGADLVVVCLGLGNDVEMEDRDRKNISLPGHQEDILKIAVAHSPSTTPILLVVFNGGAVDLRYADGEPRVSAILAVFYPSQATGTALMRALIMDGPDSVPAGRLPYTWPATDDQVPSIINYTMTGRTYRYINYQPLYPFGYGLSYTSFNYSNLNNDVTVEAGNDVHGSVDVTNVGPVDADEVVQVYISWLSSSIPTPQLQLSNFTRVHIPSGDKVTVEFSITAKTMAVWVDEATGWEVQPGNYSLHIGGQQPNQMKNVGSNVLSANFQVLGSINLGQY